MGSFLDFVQGIEDGLENARSVSASGSAQRVESDRKILLFSPHPDDECITGLLPLRLLRESGRQVINVPVTFGSDTRRQAERAAELDKACAYLGFHVHAGREGWQALDAEGAARVIAEFRPEIIFLPHEGDRHPTHVSTHFTVRDALGRQEPSFSCLLVETEYWGAMDDPNLMVAGDARSVADLVAATSLHSGEVARNPYHLLLPAWMQDNVRRGSELVLEQGSIAPDFTFATLYRLRTWRGGEVVPEPAGPVVLPVDGDLTDIL
jgi:LmbE family N-acetylglucosaminyl deacetylase